MSPVLSVMTIPVRKTYMIRDHQMSLVC